MNQSVSFTSGQTSRTVVVSITDDAIAESDETFGLIVQRTGAESASVYLAKATFTIVDNDAVSPAPSG